MIIVCLGVLSGCSDSLKPDYENSVFGTNRLSGKQINQEYCFSISAKGCVDGFKSTDTLDASFEIEFKHNSA